MVRRPRRALGERLRERRPLGELLEEHLSAVRVGPLADGAFPSRLHDERVAAFLGTALGFSFFTCFATGLVSHFSQHPAHIGFLSLPARPAELYRYTQGVHVATGIASIPLLLAKLWTVYPRLFTFPPVRSVLHSIERLSVVPLVAGSLLQLYTGLANTAHWFPWRFNFTVTHYWNAWIVIGSLLVHVAVQLPAIARGYSRDRSPEPEGTGLTRRGFFLTTAAAAGAVTLTTVGQTFRPLKAIAVLAPRRPDRGPQGVPINKSAVGARVVETARDPAWRLVVDGAVKRPLSLSRDALLTLPLAEADLPIACVEGWSAGGSWRGVRVRDLLAMAGADPSSTVVVHSIQQRGAYRTSELNVPHIRDRDTLLALELNGEPLHIDHGYPCRLIAPDRPGVQQTKWVGRLEVV
jgi:DMSO/TMAO reductase YedYZ molybdopterin-dependent catalytic subunit